MGVDKDSAAVSAPAAAITPAIPQLHKSQNHRSKEDGKVTDTTSHHRGLYWWAWCRRFASIGWATSLVIAFIFVISIVWTAFLVVINVAPNGSANAVMTTGTLDGGNFWQFSAPTDSIVSISSILLLAIVLIYSYLLLLLLFGPPAPRAPRQGRARPRQPNAQANRLRRNAATMSRLAVPLATLRRKSRPVTQFYHELVVPDGKYRKLYNVALEIPEVVLQVLSLRSYMLKGLDPPLLYLYACLMATNAYIVFYTIQFGWREDAFHQIVHDAMFDATFAVFFPALVLLYCVGNFQGDLESVKILQQYFPPHAYERTGRIYVEPAQVNTFSAGYESLIMTAVSDIFLKIAFNLLSCMRWRKILLLLMENAKQKQLAQHPRRPRVYDQFHQHAESAQAGTVTPESTSVVETRDQADQEPPNARVGQHRLTDQRPTTDEHPTMDQLLATDLARLPEPATPDTAKRTDEVPPATSHRPPNSATAPKRVVPVYVGIIFFLVGTACITYPAVVIQRTQAACADYSGCILVSYAWETTGKVCNCLAYVDRDLAPNASEVLPDVTDTLEILARAGKLETIQLINRKINQTLPDSVQLCTGLRNMVLIYTGIEEIPAWANETMTNLEYLHIEGSSDDDTNLASLPDNFFSQMSRLLSLHLAYHPSLTTLPPLEGLESLEILYFGQLDSLKEMPDFGDLPYLQAAAFEELPEVQTLPDLSTYADTLTTLVIQDMGVCCSGYLASGVCNTSFPTCCEEETSSSGSSSSTGSAGMAPSSPTSSTAPSPTSTATAASHSSSGSSSSSSHASQLSPSGSSGSSSAAAQASQSPASGSSMSSQPSQPGQSTQPSQSSQTPSQSPSSSSSSSSSASSPTSSSSFTAHSSFNGGGSGSGDAGSDGSMDAPVGQTSDGSRPLPPECLSQPVNDSSLPNNATLTLLQGFMADTTNFCDASVAVCRKKSGSEGGSAKAADVCAGVLYRQCSTGICYNPGMGRVQCVSLQSVIDMRKAEIAKGASCNKQEEQWLGCK